MGDKEKDIFIRTRMVMGDESMEKLKNAAVAIFGIGGVGSYAAEVLARAGIGKLILVDFDTIAVSNINRQLHALQNTVGRKKVDVMKERLLLINPEIVVEAIDEMYTEANKDVVFGGRHVDYCIDAIDMVSAKLSLICHCKENGIRVISSMGTGNKMDPTKFELTCISKTHMCPLAKVMRKELRDRGITKLDVVYSTEHAVKPRQLEVNEANPRKQTPGSVSFVPPVSGIIMASKVVRDLIE
jgi:tRNA threonylcarbamoyladenosine dehydratase